MIILKQDWFDMSIAHGLKSLLFLLGIFVLTGCGKLDFPATASYGLDEALTPTSFPTIPNPPTDTPTLTSTPTATFTSTITPTPVWVFQSGTITCPILLYHRIAEPSLPNSIAARYYTSPADFEWQMQALEDWGYTTIPISLLVETITKGASLPPRPVVISFDDGDETVYQNAYPIMQALGFKGVMYLVVDYIGSQGYMDVSQIQAMTDNGWEVGSHSMTHVHLPAAHDQVYFEAGQSKGYLASKIGVTVNTFAYPFGEIDDFVIDKVREYGYLAAVGLGTQYLHSLGTLYYLSRIEVRNGTDQSTFATMLPWSGQP